jgi:hypothetical protein
MGCLVAPKIRQLDGGGRDLKLAKHPVVSCWRLSSHTVSFRKSRIIPVKLQRTVLRMKKRSGYFSTKPSTRVKGWQKTRTLKKHFIYWSRNDCWRNRRIISQRDKEINEIVKSVFGLATVFKDLQVMSDLIKGRCWIDYNIEMTHVAVVEAASRN